ncbi:MAG: 50S ribosomal protein L25/general stress protein Ctc [Burkholderiales bacterium]|nr:50S ribosomal protein L25/general stress protein Ctc [Burkholderiales bacterium]
MLLELNAQRRDKHGRGASRRLRRNGFVPAIIYGLEEEATAVSLDHNQIYHALKRPNFHTSILNISVEGKVEKALLRDFQMHAYRPEVLHLDFQRVNDTEEIHIRVPLHFLNEDTAHAVKIQGAHITKVITEVEIRAKASDIPQGINVDLKNITAGQSIHLSNLVLPQNVVLPGLLRGDDAVVVIAAGIAEEVESATSGIAVSDIPTVDNKTEKSES